MKENAIQGEPVVIVEVRGGKVNLKTGRIAGPASLQEPENHPRRTVVRGDRQFYPVTESLEEAHEKAFAVDDIHLLKEQEVRSLQDPGTCQDWFGSIYQDRLVAKIHHVLKRLARKENHPPAPLRAS